MNAFSEQTRFERYRMMLITRWPESDLKQAALASARAALERELAFMQARTDDEPIVMLAVAA
jgi:hypothetical protein